MTMTKPNYSYKDVITFLLIVASTFSGYFIDKTEIKAEVTAVRIIAEKNAEKLDKANLELILYRMKQFEISMTEMGKKVDKLDTKIDASTKDIIAALDNRRR